MVKKTLRRFPILIAFVLLFSMPGITNGATNDVDVRSTKQIGDNRKRFGPLPLVNR